MTHPIGRMIASGGDPDPAGAQRAAKRFWQEHGGVAFTAEQLGQMGGLDRQFLVAAAERHYGKRDR